MEPLFTEEQLAGMSRENLTEIIKLMQAHQAKQKAEQERLEAKQKLLEEKVKELEFLNALLSDRLSLAQKKLWPIQ